MDFIKCITSKASKGLMTPKQAREVINHYEKLYSRYQHTLGDDAAAHQAATQLNKIMSETIIQRNQNKIRAALTQKRVTAEIDALTIQNKTKTYQEVMAFYERAFDRVKAVERQAFAPLNEFLEKMGSKWAGLKQDHAGMQKVVREILGENTGDAAAKELAGQAAKVMDMLHGMFRAEGGIIGKIERYFPQKHNAEAVAKVSPDQWISSLWNKLDRDNMIDESSGLPFDDDKLMKIMKQDYLDITTNGLSEIQRRVAQGKQTPGRGGDIALRRQNGRFYKFKDADAFLEYNREFGVGDDGLFGAFIGHVQTMSRDVGVMQKMGAMATGLKRHLSLKMEAAGTGKVQQKWVDGMYDVLSGATNGGGVTSAWYKHLEGAKDWVRASKAGSFVISALSDVGYTAIAAKMNGLPAMNAVGNYVKSLNPLDASHRRMAAREGFVAEGLLGSSFSTSRMTDDATGSQFTRNLVGFAVRSSGLSSFTEAAKNALPLLLQGTLAEAKIAGKKFSDMDIDFQYSAKMRGITEADFDIWMQADLLKHPANEDINFLRPHDVAALPIKGALEASRKLDEWMTRVSYLASNEPTLATRSLTTGAFAGDARPGTVNRAFWSTVGMFKGFGITQTLNYLLPAMQKARATGRLRDLTLTTIGMSVMGGLVVQLREIMYGRDPMDMSKPQFIFRAMSQGGGFGIVADYLFRDPSMFGVTKSLAGPMAQALDDIMSVTIGNAHQELEGERSNFLRDIVSKGSDYVPGMTWWAMPVIETHVIDNLKRMTDPNYDRRMKQIERKKERELGQGTWFSKADGFRRLPDMGAAFGQ